MTQAAMMSPGIRFAAADAALSVLAALDAADGATLAKLRADIEALAVRVVDVSQTHTGKQSWGKTVSGTPFTTICNGRPKGEGARPIELRPIEKMARFTLTEARKLARSIKGPALLTWRDFIYEPGDVLWVRLAFEGIADA